MSLVTFESSLCIILSLVAILTVIGGFMVTSVASHGSGANAATGSGVSYHTAHGNLSNQSLQLGGHTPTQAAPQKVFALPEHSGNPSANAATAAAQNAPAATSNWDSSTGKLLHNF